MSLSPQSIQAALQAIEQHQRILISPHANVDPDGLSSALACYQMFTAMGKDVTVICPDTKPESLSFLPGFEKFEQELSSNKDFVVTINLEDGAEIDKRFGTVHDGCFSDGMKRSIATTKTRMAPPRNMPPMRSVSQWVLRTKETVATAIVTSATNQ